MKCDKVIALAAVVAGGFVLPAAALAADLENHDDVAYDIRIHDGPATTHSSISSNTTQVSVCWSCTIEVVGVGEIEVDESVDAVIIEDGEIFTE